jgi:hypothetical protein
MGIIKCVEKKGMNSSGAPSGKTFATTEPAGAKKGVIEDILPLVSYLIKYVVRV